MRILLTGGGGFVGHHTLEHLLKNTDWEIVVIDSFRHHGISARLRAVLSSNPLFSSRVSVITHDLKTPIDRVTTAEIGEIQIIVNMASESHVDRSIENPRVFIENNTQLALTMLDFARQSKGLQLFIQVSTDEVYGPARDNYAHKEYDVILPSNPYSASKASQEAISISYWRTYDVPVVITNTMNIIGERQDPEKFFPRIITQTNKNLPVMVHAKFDNGEWKSGSRYYLHARNQADALLFLIKVHSNKKTRYSEGLERPCRYHVVGEKELKNDEIVHLIQGFMGKSSPIEYVDFQDSRPGHDLRYALDPGTLSELGWSPPIALENSIKKTIEWYSTNSNWLQSSFL
jgi:dTDP-glucose 4,6-dehydratase